MSYSIRMVDTFHYLASVIFGLDIQGSGFPLFVRCSLLTPHNYSSYRKLTLDINFPVTVRTHNLRGHH